MPATSVTRRSTELRKHLKDGLMTEGECISVLRHEYRLNVQDATRLLTQRASQTRKAPSRKTATPVAA